MLPLLIPGRAVWAARCAAGLLVALGLAACKPAPDMVMASAAAAPAPVQQAQPQTPAAKAATPFYETRFERRPSAAQLTQLGRALFFETALSASQKMSCASCHSPQHAYGPPNALAVQMGGLALNRPGLRAVPSLMYQQGTPPFSEHFNDNDGNDSEDQGPTGGRTWDGRVSSAHDQAALPFLSPLEMANPDIASVVAQLRGSPSAKLFGEVFGSRTLDDAGTAWRGMLWALEVFQQSPQDFYPYSSKYDAFLRGQAQLTAAEQRGLKVFNDPKGGNCAQCHPSAIKRGAFPVFTDYGHINIGVPRNRQIAANADPAWYDMGLCGPLRTDLKDQADYCGRFKTPSLRNVALRQSFFHNGVFHRLEDALRFYAERDVHPDKFYTRDARGRVQAYDDLPPALRGGVNTEPPFEGQRTGKAALDAAQIRDMVAFLKTLSDGYQPPPPPPPAGQRP